MKVSDERAREERKRANDPTPLPGDVYYFQGTVRDLLDDREELLRERNAWQEEHARVAAAGTRWRLRAEKLERVVEAAREYRRDPGSTNLGRMHDALRALNSVTKPMSLDTNFEAEI